MDTCYTYFRAKAFELPKRLITCYFSRYSQAGVHNVRLLTKEMIPQELLRHPAYGKHPKKYTLRSLGFDCSFAFAKTIKP